MPRWLAFEALQFTWAHGPSPVSSLKAKVRTKWRKKPSQGTSEHLTVSSCSLLSDPKDKEHDSGGRGERNLCVHALRLLWPCRATWTLPPGCHALHSSSPRSPSLTDDSQRRSCCSPRLRVFSLRALKRHHTSRTHRLQEHLNSNNPNTNIKTFRFLGFLNTLYEGNTCIRKRFWSQ